MHAELPYQPPDCLTAQVHICSRLGQNHLDPGHIPHAHLRPRLSLVEGNAMQAGKVIEALKPDIVTVIGMSFSRISQPDN